MKRPNRARTVVKYAKRRLRGIRGVTSKGRARFREREQKTLEAEARRLQEGDSPWAEGLKVAQNHGRVSFVLKRAGLFNKAISRRRLVRAAGRPALDKFGIFAPAKRKEILELLAHIRFQQERTRTGHTVDEEALHQHLQRLNGLLGTKIWPLLGAFARNVQRLER